MTEIIQWSPGVSLEMIEKQVILKAWHWYRGNKTQCSISLGINIRTLERKLDEYEKQETARRDQESTETIKRAEALDRARGIVRNESGETRILGTYSGVQEQPAFEVPAQQPLPLPQHQEVQSLLSKQNPVNGAQRRRG